MDSKFDEVPFLPLSFGLLVIVVVFFGTWLFDIEWESANLALPLVAVILLGLALLLAGRRMLN